MKYLFAYGVIGAVCIYGAMTMAGMAPHKLWKRYKRSRKGFWIECGFYQGAIRKPGEGK